MKTTLTFSLTAGNAVFTFGAMEVPSSLEGFGGKKLAALIQLEGGTRVVQTFGNVPHDAISWHGLILGPDSFSRWAQLDGFRTSSVPVTLTYGQFTWVGILEETQLLPGFEGYLPYHAKFLVQSDKNTVNVVPSPPQTTDQAASSAVSGVSVASVACQASAILVVAAAGKQALAAAVAAQQAIGNSLTQALQSNSGAVGTASAQVTAAANATFALFSATTVDPVTVATAVLPLYMALQQLANVLGTPPTVAQVTVTADGRLTNLFLLATRYTGSPNNWQQISTANGGMLPFWRGLLSVIIPNFTA
jgi:hypothetical protein